MRETLKGIYQQHGDVLYATALSITRQPDKAEDAVHQAFARLLSQPHLLKGKNTVPYVFATVRNAAIDQVRRQPKDLANGHPIPDLTANTLSPEEKLYEAESNKAIGHHLNHLPEEQREVVLMKVHGDMTFEEVGEALEIPLQTAATRYRRALDKLKQMIGAPHD